MKLRVVAAFATMNNFIIVGCVKRWKGSQKWNEEEKNRECTKSQGFFQGFVFPNLIPFKDNTTLHPQHFGVWTSVLKQNRTRMFLFQARKKNTRKPLVSISMLNLGFTRIWEGMDTERESSPWAIYQTPILKHNTKTHILHGPYGVRVHMGVCTYNHQYRRIMSIQSIHIICTYYISFNTYIHTHMHTHIHDIWWL